MDYGPAIKEAILNEPENQDQFYIAPSSRVAEPNRVLKQGDTFAVLDQYGDIHVGGLGEQGLYHEGTRYLSFLELRLNRDRPLLFLSSTVRKANELLAVDLMNPDVTVDGEVSIPRGTLHIFRSKFLLGGACYERFRISNYGSVQASITLSFAFDADYADIFEVRGTRRAARGRRLDTKVGESFVILAYEGLDETIRRTRLDCSPQPDEISSSEIVYHVSIEPKRENIFFLTVSFESGEPVTPRRIFSYQKAFTEATEGIRAAENRTCQVTSSNTQFNNWLSRSLSDLLMMFTETPQGVYAYAGVPWFSTPFGRDGIITALQMLWLDPEVARGTLSYLAFTQAREVIPESDAEPGKILHETRKGEMARLGEIPFGSYYGSVDSTPLFIILAGAYHEYTGDIDFIDSIWPNIELALAWIDNYGDSDGDGFVEYARHTPDGLVQQGWKDSHDSIFHEDGSLAEPPIALSEVQGYVYDAKIKASKLASILGLKKRAEEIQNQASVLKDKFERAFWCEDLFSYALALDGAKRQCRVRASNAGHCLFSGISSPERARSIAQLLMSESFYSGWGIRTLANTEVRYNPMSYHNGSIWPHDNSLIAYGFSRYGLTALAAKVLSGFFDAATNVDMHRLPELFCGFRRRSSQGPTLYPVACAPQAWAAGSVFMLLQACLGLSVDAPNRRLQFNHPNLPEFLREIEIRKLKVGSASVDLLIRRHPEGSVGINVLRREGPVDVITVK